MRQRQLDKTEMELWRKSVGGTAKAVSIVMEKFEWSKSMAEKVVGGRYPSVPSALEQIALAALMGRPRDVAFPFVRAKGKRAA